MINKPQKTIHISFNDEDEDLYFHIMRQTSRTLIPVATYCRFLMKQGIKNKQTEGTTEPKETDDEFERIWEEMDRIEPLTPIQTDYDDSIPTVPHNNDSTQT